MPKSAPLAGYLHFLWAGLVKHAQTGALFPCQRVLVQTMIAPISRDYCGRVLELGTGNGTLTLRLAAQCPHARIVTCEINPVLARDAQLNLARAGINGQVQVRATSAQELLSQLRAQSDERPGYIVSGLPLGNLGKRSVLELLRAAHQVLPENGLFVQVQHLLFDRKHIRAVFGNVRTVPVLLNFPPAFVYYARK